MRAAKKRMPDSSEVLEIDSAFNEARRAIPSKLRIYKLVRYYAI